MARILWIHKDQCEVLEFESTLIYENFVFELKKKLSFIYKDKIFILEDHEFIKVEDYVIGFDSMLNEKWYCFLLKPHTTIGRGLECSLPLRSKNISKTHMSIDAVQNIYELNDLKSTNGVYLNGKRVRHAILQNGDQIVLGHIIIYYVHGYLFLNHPCMDECSILPSPICMLKKKWSIQQNRIFKSLEVKSIDLENPDILEAPVKAKLYSCLGSSFMILFSSLISGCALYLLSNIEGKMIFTMMFSSVSMSISFFLYGFIHRHIEYKTRCKQYDMTNQLYVSYLKEVECEIEAQKAEIDCLVNEQIETCTIFKKETFGCFHELNLFVGLDKIQLLKIHTPSISYRTKMDPLIQKQKEFIQNHTLYMSCPVFLKQGMKVWVKKSFQEVYGRSILSQILWQHYGRDIKVVFVTNYIEKVLSLTDLPCTLYNEHRLILNQNNQEWFYEQGIHLKLDVVYIVLEPECASLINSENATVIYINEKSATFTFNAVIKESVITVLDTCKKRNVLRYMQENTDLHLNEIMRVEKHWKRTQVCLKFQIGYDEKNQPIYFDLSEQGNGPHVLVAGTTGSGKSEWLTTMLMMLVTQNNPQIFQYILIDFKGEAFAKNFSNFPHCAGIVSNLEKDSMHRFCLSMEAEIVRRQRKVKELLTVKSDAIAHIDAYNQIFYEKPISHLLIVIDEFAQLKTKYPEYMMTIIEFSRIGRSLGIHLILSTQKPAGIVNEQIMSNMNGKVCLKVNSIQDSREILHQDSAFWLTKSGQFILQDNQGNIKQGQAFYLREPFEDDLYFKEVNDRDEILIQDGNESKTIYEVISRHILKQNINQRWILYPELSMYKNFNHGFFLVDYPSKQRQGVLELFGNLSVLTTQPNDFIEAVLKRYRNKSIYIYGEQKYCDFVDDVFTDADFMEKIQKVERDSILLVVNKNVNVCSFSCLTVCIYETLNFHLELENKLAYKYDDIESLRLFFNDFHIQARPKYPLLQHNGLIAECIFNNTGNLVEKNEKKYIEIEHNTELKLGVDLETNENVFHSFERKLIFLYVQKSARTFIDSFKQLHKDKKFSEDLMQDADFYICNVLKMDQLYFESVQYDMDLLWVGLGYQEYGFFIKRRIERYIPSKLIYFHDEKCRCLRGDL